MALTAQEEALVRQLLDEQAAILSLAGSEATILSKLGATKVTLSDLTAASTVSDADLLLMRQGTTDKSLSAALLYSYIYGSVSVVTRKIITSSGTYVKPAGLRAVRIELQAPGAGGGASQAASTTGHTSLGAAGGAGAFVSGHILAANLASSETITIASAGLGGSTSGANGTSPGSTSFGSHVTFTAPGFGTGGPAATSANTRGAIGGIGGTATVAGTIQGGVITPGSNGTIGIRWSDGVAIGSAGGRSHIGIGGDSAIQGGSGNIGVFGGGGGGGTTGATGASDSFRVGGNGGSGVFIITEFF